MTELEVCKEKHKHIEEALDLHNERLNKHSERLDLLEKDIAGSIKDVGFLKETIADLRKSIDKLIEAIDSLKLKPLAKYEQIAMFIITAIVAYVLGKVL
jgi:chromosome segregation ATPase